MWGWGGWISSYQEMRDKQHAAGALVNPWAVNLSVNPRAAEQRETLKNKVDWGNAVEKLTRHFRIFMIPKALLHL